MSFEFAKMHGLGNSFVVTDDRRGKLRNLPALTLKVCDQHFGIGADGLIIVRRSKRADLRMIYLNADGTRAEMCGNGIRCFARFVADRRIARARKLKVETDAGVLETELKAGGSVRVDMGAPAFRSRDLPTPAAGKEVASVKSAGREFLCVSMGNPHAVTFVPDFDFDIEREGSKVENDTRLFPNRTNVGFVRRLSADRLRVRVWERGCGLTLACGTGACAGFVAAVTAKMINHRSAKVVLDGGELEIEWDERSGHIYMTGPATTVAEGTCVF